MVIRSVAGVSSLVAWGSSDPESVAITARIADRHVRPQGREKDLVRDRAAERTR